MTKELIRGVKDGLRRQKLFIASGCVEFLEKENEELKQQVSYLKDNLRVARKDREDLRAAVANGLEDFLKENPFTSLSLWANKKLKEENELLKVLFINGKRQADLCYHLGLNREQILKNGWYSGGSVCGVFICKSCFTKNNNARIIKAIWKGYERYKKIRKQRGEEC